MEDSRKRGASAHGAEASGGSDETSHERRPRDVVYEYILQAIGDADQESRIADLGCGRGRLSGKLRARFPAARIVGGDSEQRQLDEARKQIGSSVEWVKLSLAEALPFANGELNHVAVVAVVHYLPPEVLTIAAGEIARVLGLGGHAFVSDIHPRLHEIRNSKISDLDDDETRPDTVREGASEKWERRIYVRGRNVIRTTFEQAGLCFAGNPEFRVPDDPELAKQIGAPAGTPYVHLVRMRRA